MIWLLVSAGILLLLLGLWGGPVPTEAPEPEAAPPAGEQAASAAWDVLARPIVHREELIPIPEHRPWYMPGKDRRFLQGLMVGLGSGLLVTAVAVGLFPRTAPQPTQVAANNGSSVSVPKTNEPAPTAQPPAAAEPPAAVQPPAATEPAPPAEQQPSVTPVNITFVIEDGDLAPDIARKLKEAGLIADEQAFLTRVEQLEVDRSLKAGTFVIPTHADLDTVINVLIA